MSLTKVKGKVLPLDNIKNPDGYKLIGEVDSISLLRNIEPTITNQKIKLKSYYQDLNIGGGDFYYDINDTTSTDNGFSIIVTSGGKRWKKDISAGVNIYSAGYNPSTNNLHTTIKTIVDYLVQYAITNGYSKLPTNKIIIPNNINNQPYKVQTITLPSILTLSFEGNILLDFSSSDQIGIRIDNSQYPGLTNAVISTEGFQVGGCKVITTNGGKLNIKGIGSTLSNQGGIVLGNTAAGFLHTRDVIIENCVVYGFIAGVRIKSRDTYINEFRDVKFTKNKHAILADDTTATNSGEKTTFIKCIISDSDSDGIRINGSAQDFDFISCHVDYNNGATIFFASSGAYCDLAFIGGHIEGIGSVLVSQSTQIAGAGPNKVNFTNVKFDLRSAVNNTVYANRSLRQMFSASSLIYINVLNCSFSFQNGNVQDYGVLIPPGDDTSTNRVQLNITSKQSNYPEYLPSYKQALNPYQFNGTAGVDISSGSDSATGITVITANGTTVAYGTADANGFIPLEITSTQTSGVATFVFDKKLYFPYTQPIYGMVSVRPNSSTGNINVSCGLRGYNDYTINTSTGAIVENLLGTSYDTTVDAMIYFTNGSVATTNFISTEPLICRTYGRFVAYSKPSLRLTGFVGTVSIKLPAWWFKN